MKHPFENIIAKTGREPILSDLEREKMRFVLTEYMAFKPLPRTVISPQPAVALFSFLRRRTAWVTAFALVLVTLSSSVAYAAEGALPGDPLYSVKVSVTEPVRTLLARSPASQAGWQMTLAERRLNEATALAQKGTLAIETETALATNFSKSAHAADQAIATEQTSDPVGAAVSAARFTGRLSAHVAVLVQVSNSDTRHAIALLTSQVEDELTPQTQTLAANAPTIPMMMQKNEGASASPRTEKRSFAAASELGTAATEALRMSADLIGAASSTLSTSTSERARDELAHALSVAEKGRHLLDTGDNSGASEAFRDSLSATGHLDVLTHAATAFQINAFATTTATSSATFNTGSSTPDSGQTQASGEVNATSSSDQNMPPIGPDRSWLHQEY